MASWGWEKGVIQTQGTVDAKMGGRGLFMCEKGGRAWCGCSGMRLEYLKSREAVGGGRLQTPERLERTGFPLRREAMSMYFEQRSDMLWHML